MIMSNRAAALRWLTAHVGQTLDTMQYDAAGELRWVPGPRVLARASAEQFTMTSDRVGQVRASYISTDRANRFYIQGDTLVIETMTILESGPSGARETWRVTHYSVRQEVPFTIAELAAASDGRIKIIPVSF